VIEKYKHKYLTNIKPMTPNINAYKKTYNINERIRPVINNIHAPLYKVAKCLNKKTKKYSMFTKYREHQKLI